jgi:hypothetical protein
MNVMSCGYEVELTGDAAGAEKGGPEEGRESR